MKEEWRILLDCLAGHYYIGTVIPSQNQSCVPPGRVSLQSSSAKSCLGTNEVNNSWFCIPAKYLPKLL